MVGAATATTWAIHRWATINGLSVKRVIKRNDTFNFFFDSGGRQNLGRSSEKPFCTVKMGVTIYPTRTANGQNASSIHLQRRFHWIGTAVSKNEH